MHHQTLLATYGGLLHDVGKVAYRSGGPQRTHSIRGYDFLRECWEKTECSSQNRKADRESVLDCVRYHHEDALKNAEPPDDSLAWIVCAADNIAAAADRREEEGIESSEVKGRFSFNRYLPLNPVFSKLNGRHDGYIVLPSGTDETETVRKCFLPSPQSTRLLNQEDYKGLLSQMRKRFAYLTLDEWQINPLLLALEDTTGSVPSSTSLKEVPDISLYDHLKITAAASACISEYALAEGITDFRTFCFRKKAEFYAASVFLLYEADISGIQKFIYTVSTKNALRSLRGRSFFLELLMEHYIDELLSKCGLSRANLIFNGGGHCLLLLPNTDAVREILERWNRNFNNWLLEAFGTRLYLADGWSGCSAHGLTSGMLKGKKKNAADSLYSLYKILLQKLNNTVEIKKNRRYSAEQILRMNAGEADRAGRECRICGRTDFFAKRMPEDEQDGTDICQWCKCFEDLSSGILTRPVCLVEQRKDAFPLYAARENAALVLPAIDGTYVSCRLFDEKSARERLQSPELSRLYLRNVPLLEKSPESVSAVPLLETFCTARLDAGVYAPEDKNTLDSLADMSQGIRRLGVCRMDVDNMGQAFVEGFEQPDAEGEARYHYVTLSRTAAFSRQMSLFFKRHINAILDGSAGISIG